LCCVLGELIRGRADGLEVIPRSGRVTRRGVSTLLGVAGGIFLFVVVLAFVGCFVSAARSSHRCVVRTRLAERMQRGCCFCFFVSVPPGTQSGGGSRGRANVEWTLLSLYLGGGGGGCELLTPPHGEVCPTQPKAKKGSEDE
jgi:hypothetical protein